MSFFITNLEFRLIIDIFNTPIFICLKGLRSQINFDKTKGAVVVPLRDSTEVVVGCAAFVLVELSRDDVSQIRQKSIKFLDSIFFPRKIYFIKDFPRSQSGKIDRKALEQSAKQLSSV